IAIVTSILYLAPAPTVRSPLSLHDALPISVGLIGAQIASACMKTARRRLPVFRKFTGKARLAVLRRARTTLTEGLGRRVQSPQRSEEHTSELQPSYDLVCRLLIDKKKTKIR